MPGDAATGATDARLRMRDALRDEGFRLGFAAVGFAAARDRRAGERFARWLEAGHHGEMGWLERSPERRSNAGFRPDQTTVVVCALNYWAGEPASAPPGGGVVSQYARGEDYHRVANDRLRALARFAAGRAEEEGLVPEDASGRRFPVLVDHGPLLEKAYAVNAGIGWIGKHSNVLAERGGSWFFLGEVLLPFLLPPDEAPPDRCGTCAKCIDACPTGAIVQPYVVDSRRCISYLTIELRGPIPRPLRAPIGLRIFGCDDCQDVCPWNRFAEVADEPRLAANPNGLQKETLADLLRLTPEEFGERTRRSAIRRAGYAGFLRNVAVALGNAGDTSAFGPLRAALAHAEPLVRGHAAWALGRCAPDLATGPLRARLPIEADGYVRGEIEATLEEIGAPVQAPA